MRLCVRLSVLFASLPLVCAFHAMGEQLPTDNVTIQSTLRKAAIAVAYGKLPLSFEASEGHGNPGQEGGAVKYMARGQGYGLFLTGKGAILTLSQREKAASGAAATRTDTITMGLAGSNPNATVTGRDQLPGTVNYFVGSDQAKWRTSVPTFAQVNYEGVYPGVDLVYYGNQRQLEYDFVVAPGADSGAIRLQFTGAKQLRIDDDGALRIEGSHGSIDFHKPVIYQQEGGQRREVEGEFRLLAGNTVAFRLGSYDHALPLVIDPVLEYSTYLGGSFGQDLVSGIAVDKSGNLYVTGQAASTDFPVTGTAYQTTNTTGGKKIFVTKFNATGNMLLYSTYLGGTSGGDFGFAIAVDASGDAYITGQVSSTDFPVSASAFQTTKPGRENAFATKLNADGSGLVYSTFLGGSYFDSGNGIAIDASGNAYIVGSTGSTNFPVTANSYQMTNHAGGYGNGFVTKLNATGSAEIYSTYLGGSGGDVVNGIAIASTGNAYVTGIANSIDFPTTPGVFQPAAGFPAGYGGHNAFVAAFSSDGTGLIYSTYLGGSYADRGYGIAVDSAGRAFVTGSAYSDNFPVTPGAFQTSKTVASAFAFVTKFNAAGTGLVYSTFLGGTNSTDGAEDSGSSIFVDAAGDAYVTGYADSRNFPVTANSYQTANPGGPTAFVSELNESGTGIVYSTYLGGSNYDFANGLAVDSNGGIYVAGQTFSTDFPTTSGAFLASDPVVESGNSAGNSSGFVSKLQAGGVPAILTSPGLGTVLPNSVTFNWTAGTGVTAYQLWVGTTAGASNLYNSHGTTAHSETVTNIPMNGGTVFVTLFSEIGGVYTGNPYTYIAMGTPAKAVLTTPAPGSTLTGSSATFAWTAGTGVTAYQLWLGSTPGANNLYNSHGTAALSVTATGLPTNGGTIFATLYSLIDSGYTANSYTYVAAGTPAKAVLSTPSPGSTLSGTSTTFYWTAGTGVTNYQLWLGTTAGANNLYNSRGTYSTSVAVTGLPASGGTIFATLFSLIDGTYQSNAYTYIASGTAVPAVLTTPTPGSVLPGASVTFDWNAGTGVTAYQFWLGTTAGTSNLYNSHGTNALTANVAGLPLNSEKIYATLFSLIDGAYKSNAYVYTASSGMPIEAVLYSFTGNQQTNTDGAGPQGNLTMDGSGNIYGTTMNGGTGNAGTVFKLTPSGTETVLHSFQNNGIDGFNPYGGVSLDAQGNIYGTTRGGGNGAYGETPGTVFKLTPQGVETILYNFGSYSGDGMYPDAGLIFDGQGNLYGTTSAGGTSSDGTVFKITPAGNEVVLYNFSGTDGQMPLYGSLAMDAAGNLYGTTYSGGTYGYGTVFKVTPGGPETVLHNFNSDGMDGVYPAGGVVLDAQGNLYGTTYNGGANGAGGVVYKVTPSGAETILYSFNLQGVNGFYDSERSLVLDKQGNLYGTTTGEVGGDGGNVFELMPSGAVTVLHTFAAYATDGSLPTSGLLFDAKGNLYGVTQAGGTVNGGAVFEITPVS